MRDSLESLWRTSYSKRAVFLCSSVRLFVASYEYFENYYENYLVYANITEYPYGISGNY